MDVASFLRITVRRTCSGSEHFFVWPEQVTYNTTNRVLCWGFVTTGTFVGKGRSVNDVQTVVGHCRDVKGKRETLPQIVVNGFFAR